jgi:hypothetical protein
MKDEDIEQALRSMAVPESKQEPLYQLDEFTLNRLAAIHAKACQTPPEEKRQGAFARLREWAIFPKSARGLLAPAAAVLVTLLAVSPFLRSGDPWTTVSPESLRGGTPFTGQFTDFNGELGIRPDFPARKLVIRLAGGVLLSGDLSADPSPNEPRRPGRQYYRADVTGSLADGTVVRATGPLVVVDPVLAQTPTAPVAVAALNEMTLTLEVFVEGRSLGKLERVRRR